MKKLLKKCYKIAVIIPAIIGIIATTIFSIIDSIGYKSEWLTREFVIISEIIFTAIYCGIICVLALTIFFNLFEKVRKNLFIRIFSWFLLPFSFISMVIIHEFHLEEIEYFIPVILINIPFIFGLILSYVIFLKNKQKI
ncbi:MAG: hypothetical protein FWH36_05665 [Lentimicrobiaceae bacterium]|nr:hypothetical protein [Lentimicrobiaceae bacterium]